MKTANDLLTPPLDGGSSSAIEVEINDGQDRLAVDHDALVALIRETLLDETKPIASISIAIVDNATIHALNRTHLNHDWPTDVITFPLSDHDDEELQGELVVSAEMAVETAREANVDPWHEFALYVVHGLLHLCGHDDGSDAKRTK